MVIMGEFFIALNLGQPPLAGIIGGLAQTLEATLVILGLKRRITRGITTSVKSMLWFSMCGVLVPPLFAAFIGSTSLWLLGFLGGSEYLSGLITWWLGDAIGILVLTPLIVDLRSWPFKKTSSFLSFLGLTAVTAGICVAIIFFGNEKSYYLFFVLIPMVVVSAIHFSLAGAGSITLLLTVIVFGMRPQDLGHGDFITAIRMAFVGTCGFTGYLVAAFMQKRQQRVTIIKQQNKYLQALNEVVLGLVGHLEIDRLLEAIVTHACDLLGTGSGYLFKMEKDKKAIKLIVGKGMYADVIGYEVKPGEGAAGTVWATGEMLIVNQYREWEGRHPDPLWNNVSAIMGVPITVNSQLEGVLGVLQTDKKRQFTEEDLNIIRQFGELASVAWKNAMVYTELSNQLTARQQAEKALKISEKTYREIYNATSEAMIVVSRESGKVLQANQASRALFGTTPVKESADFFSSVRGSGLPFDGENGLLWANSIISQHPHVCEWQVRNGAGSLQWMEITIKKTVIKEMDCILVVARDIEESKIIKQQLIQAQKMEAIGTLTGGIAHDFNNILSGIIGHAELAINFNLPVRHPASENVREILQAGRRASDLVRQMLTFCHSTEVELKPIDVKPVIKEVLKFISSSIPPGIKLRADLSADQGHVLGSPTAIHQILMNLVTNAMHAIADGKGQITVSLKRQLIQDSALSSGGQLYAGNYIELSVSDTGCGMDPATVDKIFEPYFTTKAPGKGTGLGLSVIHGIVNSLNGAIQVESKPGTGSTFHILLPLVESTTDSSHELDPMLPEGNESILFVDDNPLLTDIITQLLGKLGYNVTVFADSTIALNHFQKTAGKFHLVITDMLMPNMTGIELARGIKAIRPDIPIIISTGNPNNIDAEDIEEIGISEVAKKPLDLTDLAVMIRRAVENRPE